VASDIPGSLPRLWVWLSLGGTALLRLFGRISLFLPLLTQSLFAYSPGIFRDIIFSLQSNRLVGIQVFHLGDDDSGASKNSHYEISTIVNKAITRP
jgi:hypothetical protein